VASFLAGRIPFFHDSLKFENRIVTRAVPISSLLLKNSIKLPQARLARLQEMRPIGIVNCGGPVDHFSNVDSRLRFSERVSSASKNLKPLVQVSKGVRFGVSQSGAVCRKTGYRRGASLRGFDSIIFQQADAETRQGISGFGRVESMGLRLFREE
jgi:hypothetical protein